MPVDEDELETQHKQLHVDSADVITKSSDRLTDTTVFQETMAKLDRQISKQWEMLSSKNIDLWKIHADDVTQCALGRMRRQDVDCNWHGCTYHYIGFLHEKNANNHITFCFKKFDTKMGEVMQQKVFHSWYTKELSAEASRAAWNSMFVGFVLLTLFVFYGFYKCGWLGSHGPQMQNGQQFGSYMQHPNMQHSPYQQRQFNQSPGNPIQPIFNASPQGHYEQDMNGNYIRRR